MCYPPASASWCWVYWHTWFCLFTWCPESANAEKQSRLVVVEDWGRVGRKQSWLSPFVGEGKVVWSLVTCTDPANVPEVNELYILWGWVLWHTDDVAQQWNISESRNSETKTSIILKASCNWLTKGENSSGWSGLTQGHRVWWRSPHKLQGASFP